MHPAWLNPIEPRTFDRQLRDDDPHATLSLGFMVMLLDPVPDLAQEVPKALSQTNNHAFLRSSC
jgi:hypothetical protein